MLLTCISAHWRSRIMCWWPAGLA